jgi:hypothetical protein
VAQSIHSLLSDYLIAWLTTQFLFNFCTVTIFLCLCEIIRLFYKKVNYVWIIASNISKISSELVLEVMGSTSEWLLTCLLPHWVLKFVILIQKLTFNFWSVANNCYIFYFTKYCHVFRDCDYRWGMDWWMNLLTTYKHDSELQVITVLSLISTLHKSPQYLLSIFQPAVSSPAIPWQWLLTVEIL